MLFTRYFIINIKKYVFFLIIYVFIFVKRATTQIFAQHLHKSSLFITIIFECFNYLLNFQIVDNFYIEKHILICLFKC